ncbi:FAD-dependent monooxygenase [Sesbania bispinosa]|nr:FAD-dependent monooxygenase [Sesbania bispinosa]
MPPPSRSCCVCSVSHPPPLFLRKIAVASVAFVLRRLLRRVHPFSVRPAFVLHRFHRLSVRSISVRAPSPSAFVPSLRKTGKN